MHLSLVKRLLPDLAEPAPCFAPGYLSLKAVQDPTTGTRRIEGIASTPNPDRMQDIVEPKGAVFTAPLPLLRSHNHKEPIGWVTETKVTDGGIAIAAELPDDTSLPYLEEAWKQIKLGLMRGLSIGFRPIEYAFIEATGGIHFTKWEWLELSACTVPAQPDAHIRLVKAIDREATLAALGIKRARTVVPIHRAAPGAPPVASPKGQTMRLAEQIEAKQTHIAGLRDQMTTVANGFADREPNEQEGTMLNELAADIEHQETTLATLQKTEATLARSSQRAPVATVIGAPAIIVPKRTIARVNKADLLFKSACCFLVAHTQKQALSDVLRERYPTDDDVATVVKAAVNPADTVTPGWAQELVGVQIAEFLDILTGVSVYGALASQSLRITFDRNGLIKVPARNVTPNMAGVFVGEGQPIPVKKGGLTSVTLSPHKAAVISTFTRELAQLSNPSIEGVIRDGILEDTGVQIDINLLDAVAADAIRPAGLLHGVTTIPSSGSDAADIANDMRALLDAITAAGGGRKLALIINPSRLVGLSTVMNAAGQFVFREEVARGTLFGAQIISSTHVPGDIVILIDVADFVTATGDTPEWNVSDVATIHEESATPLPIVAGGTAATPVRSLWQTATVGIRMILQITWAMRRAGMVAALSGVGW